MIMPPSEDVWSRFKKYLILGASWLYALLDRFYAVINFVAL